MTLDPPLNAWPHFDPVTPITFYTQAAKLFNAWLDVGVSVPFAVAMVTQADMEAAFKPTANGDSKQAFNIYQWHWRPRGMAIYKAIGIDVRSETNLAKIVEAAMWEFKNVEKKAFAEISAATNAADASRAACVYFEGAGAKGAADRRAAEAERWAVFFQNNLSWVNGQG